ncbi:MAG: iron donor protein CyaY [Rickettsiales bacterium]
MDETLYHTIADATLMHCFDQLEQAYDNGALDDLELDGGILTLITPGNKTFLLTKHAPSRQLWLASPLSGGLHFSYAEGEHYWHLPDGRKLYELLRGELASQGIEVVL